MTRQEFIDKNPILTVCEANGIRLTGNGTQRMARCIFHQDKQASLSVNVDQGTWFCHAGCGSGGVIDLLAKVAGIAPVEFLKREGIIANGHAKVVPVQPKIQTIYSYQNALGQEVYQVVRMVPKTFRQRHVDTAGNWVWNMEGVERVLYRLPQTIKSEQVWIVEGEKDADNLGALGLAATCNVGGAGKWLDAYSECLAGKDVVICGDNDKPGQAHVETVFASLAGKVKTAKIVKVPDPHKDASDLIAAVGPQRALAALSELAEAATPFIRGIKLPLFTMSEIEPRYRSMVRAMSKSTLKLGSWLPSLGFIRPLIPGELVLLLGDTGVGKTALLQAIAFHARPLPTVMFELELPEELLFERFSAMASGSPCSLVEDAYVTSDDALAGAMLDAKFPGLLICSQANLGLPAVEDYIRRSELKLGTPPVLVLIDYVQLVAGIGKRYERTSDAAEGLKVMAKSTRTIIVVASQVHRPDHDDTLEISLHSGKDSGSLENSSGLVLGAWRDAEDKTLMHLKVLKNTKGTAGKTIACNFNGETMAITERSPVRDCHLERREPYA